MNPFDIKSALLARHAQHVVLIHFPIALFLVGVGFDFVAQRTKDQALAAIAYYNLLAAAISTLPVLLTGVLAWQWVLGGHKPKGVLLLHFALASATSALIWVVAWLHFRSRRDPACRLPLYRFPIEVVAAVAVALTAHLGGFLSGINGG
ncbi:MAG TPA: DUF2231 domain-containing protein [Terriglobales bacterium]|nr:DUF2231 domain-containing protein [Terriglobales bacterium]